MTPADCLFRWARDAFDLGDYSAALGLVRKGLARAPDHPGLLQVSGLAAYHLGEPFAALDRLEAAAAVAPLDPQSRLALADLYARSGRRATARVDLRFLAEPGRCPIPLLPDLARLLGRVGAYRAALRVCRQLLAARPWYHPAHYGAAYYLSKLNRPAGGVIRHLRAAAQLAPRALPYRAALAGALVGVGRAGAACRVIRETPLDAVACVCCLRRFTDAAEAAGDDELAALLRDRLREVTARGCGEGCGD